MNNILIIGSSGHAKVVIDIIMKEGKYNIAGLIDRFRNVGEQTLGYSILGKEEDLPGLIKTHVITGVIIAIGDNDVRSKVASQVREISPDLPFISAIHPSAQIGMDVSIGEGTVIMSGACINPSSSIGRFCILGTNCSLGHDSIMEDCSSLYTRVTTGGNCRIGLYSAICIGAVLVPGTRIGEQTIIGAGSVVLKDVGSFVVAYGAPAKKIRSRSQGDKYV